MKYLNVNDNILANRWKERYAQQSEEVRAKLDRLSNARVAEYQLQIISRKRKYPQIGDIFRIKPAENILLYGIVINNHIKNINGEELLVVLIFKKDINIMKIKEIEICDDNLLIPPQIVGKEYWSRGYFYNEDTMKIENYADYGFYDIFDNIYVDEYGNTLKKEPKMLGMYSVATISGIARKINQEFIISGII